MQKNLQQTSMSNTIALMLQIGRNLRNTKEINENLKCLNDISKLCTVSVSRFLNTNA